MWSLTLEHLDYLRSTRNLGGVEVIRAVRNSRACLPAGPAKPFDGLVGPSNHQGRIAVSKAMRLFCACVRRTAARQSCHRVFARFRLRRMTSNCARSARFARAYNSENMFVFACTNICARARISASHEPVQLLSFRASGLRECRGRHPSPGCPPLFCKILETTEYNDSFRR